MIIFLYNFYKSLPSFVCFIYSIDVHNDDKSFLVTYSELKES